MIAVTKLPTGFPAIAIMHFIARSYFQKRKYRVCPAGLQPPTVGLVKIILCAPFQFSGERKCRIYLILKPVLAHVVKSRFCACRETGTIKNSAANKLQILHVQKGFLIIIIPVYIISHLVLHVQS